MSATKLLPAGMLWKQGGHLTDEAIVAIADDQGIVPEDAILHAMECDECARAMGEAALLSLALGEPLAAALAEAPGYASPASQRAAPLPLWALIFGLGFVGVGAATFLLGLGAWLPRSALVLQRSVPVFAHGLVTQFAGDALPRAMVSIVALAVLMTSAFAMSRLAPREEVAP